ncbi:MAG: hypothetical protein ACMXX8_03235 [Candidatus Woesearchaeota archaeon]
MTKKESIKNFKKSNLEYEFLSEKNCFVHNFDKDLQLVIIWENGRRKEKVILDIISENFKVLYCAEINWSDKLKESNFNRIYLESSLSKSTVKKHDYVGKGKFLCIIFEDTTPNYGYFQSLDGTISIGNINVVKTKSYLRNLLNGNLIHSSANLCEFFQQAILIFHEKKLKKIINIKKWDKRIHKLNQDLAGANGWSNFSEMFSIANFCSDWVILRNFEFFPDDFFGNDEDIDILCDNLNIFYSSINAIRRDGGINSFQTFIDKKKVLLDIRFVGDNYFDPLWEQKMLSRKKYVKNNIPVLRDDDYFFSLFYHTKIQKKVVKKSYLSKLVKLSKKINFFDFKKSVIEDDQKAGYLIEGYLKSNNFSFFYPLDTYSYINKSVIKYVDSINNGNNISFSKFIRNVYSITPPFLQDFIPIVIKKRIKKGLKI